MQNWILKFQDYQEETTEASVVLSNFLAIVRSYGITADLIRQNVTMVTDRGSNLIAAFRNFKRLDDPCHMLNTFTKRVVEPYKAGYLPTTFTLTNAQRGILAVVEAVIKNTMKIIKAVKLVFR